MKILSITGDQNSGVTRHRQIVPHLKMAAMFPDVELTSCALDQVTSMEADIIFITGMSVPNEGAAHRMVLYLKQTGVKIILDIDDIWAAYQYTDTNGGKFFRAGADKWFRIINILAPAADLIITPSKELVKEIKAAFEKQAVYIPHTFPLEYFPGVTENMVLSETRFGWFGASTHAANTSVLREAMAMCADERMKVFLFGYAEHLEVTETKMGVIPTPAHMKQWPIIRDNLSGGGKLAYAGKFNIVTAKHAEQYHVGYCGVNACLAPLNHDRFNKYKSNLRIIEAGAFGRAVIASPVWPYRNMPVRYASNTQQWVEHIKYYSSNQQAAIDDGATLKEYVNKNNNPETWAEFRYELYKKLIKP